MESFEFPFAGGDAWADVGLQEATTRSSGCFGQARGGLQVIVREMCYVLNMREIEAWYLIFGCRQEMEKHKQLLDKEYEQLLTQFSKVIIEDLNQQLKILFSMIIYNQGRKCQRGVKLCGSPHIWSSNTASLILSPGQSSDSFFGVRNRRR